MRAVKRLKTLQAGCSASKILNHAGGPLEIQQDGFAHEEQLLQQETGALGARISTGSYS
jgi:hypothetical protein